MKRYGFLVVFGLLFLISVAGFANEDRQHAKDDHAQMCEFLKASNPQAECPPFEYDTSSFWDGFWENWQSEWAQLFVQGLVLVALAERLAKKESENNKKDIREVLAEQQG